MIKVEQRCVYKVMVDNRLPADLSIDPFRYRVPDSICLGTDTGFLFHIRGTTKIRSHQEFVNSSSLTAVARQPSCHVAIVSGLCRVRGVGNKTTSCRG